MTTRPQANKPDRRDDTDQKYVFLNVTETSVGQNTLNKLVNKWYTLVPRTHTYHLLSFWNQIPIKPSNGRTLEVLLRNEILVLLDNLRGT